MAKKQLQFFMGVRRSFGEMTNEKTGEKITWDNVIINRMSEIDAEKNEGAIGYEILAPLKIKLEDFKDVTSMTYEQFLETATKSLMQPIMVMFGELRGNGENRKADVELFRFVKKDGSIDF